MYTANKPFEYLRLELFNAKEECAGMNDLEQKCS